MFQKFQKALTMLFAQHLMAVNKIMKDIKYIPAKLCIRQQLVIICQQYKMSTFAFLCASAAPVNTHTLTYLIILVHKACRLCVGHKSFFISETVLHFNKALFVEALTCHIVSGLLSHSFKFEHLLFYVLQCENFFIFDRLDS